MKKIENTPDIERYVDFYKWIDNSITQMTLQLIPASANFSNSLNTIVESHVLERNKYWNKFPTLELKQEPPEAGFQSIGKLKYNWKFGHAPVGLQESDNCLWWRERAERDDKTGTDLNSARALILSTTLSILNRRFTQVYDVLSDVKAIDKNPKSVELAKQITSFGSNGYLVIEADDFITSNCDDDDS